MSRPARWMTIAAVAAVAAAGGAAWGLRRGRSTTAPPEPIGPTEIPALHAAEPTPRRPAMQPDRPPAAAKPMRRSLVAVTGVAAAAIAVGVVATHIDRPTNAGRQAPAAIATSYFPVYTPTVRSTSVWMPEATVPLWTPPTTTPPPTTPPTTAPPKPVQVGQVLAPDISVVMPGSTGEEMTLTVVRIANPAPTVDPDNPSGETLPSRVGQRLVSVVVQVENTGGVPFLDDIEKYGVLVDRAGRTYPRNVAMADARQLHPAAQLDPKWWVSREIVFEVNGSVELTRFRMSTQPGVAKQTQDWRLKRIT